MNAAKSQTCDQTAKNYSIFWTIIFHDALEFLVHIEREKFVLKSISHADSKKGEN